MPEYAALAEQEAGSSAENGGAAHEFLREVGILPTRAAWQAARLAEAGLASREQIVAMPEQDLRRRAGLVAEDLQLVAAWRRKQSLAAADLVLFRSALARQSGIAAQSPQGQQRSKAIEVMPDQPCSFESAAAGTDSSARGTRRLATHVRAIGQTVWVHNRAHSRAEDWVPWQRGIVAAYATDPRSGSRTSTSHNNADWGIAERRPLVCPTEGWPSGDCKGFVRWNAEEASIPHAWQHVVSKPPGWAMKDVQSEFASFRVAAQNSRSSCSHAAGAAGQQERGSALLCEARLRLIVTFCICHLLQPVAYCLSFESAWKLGILRPEQRILGLCVAAREVLYFLLSVACVARNPSFFLLDVAVDITSQTLEEEASGDGVVVVSGGHKTVASVTCAVQHICMAYLPLTRAVFSSRAVCACSATSNNSTHVNQSCYCPGAGAACLVLYWLLDLCAVAALGAGVGADDLSPALVLSYGATALGAIWSAAGCWILQIDEHSAARRRALRMLGLQCLALCILLFIGFDLAEVDLADREAASSPAAPEIDLGSSGSGGKGQLVILKLTSVEVEHTHYFRAFLWCVLLGVFFNLLRLFSLLYVYCQHGSTHSKKVQRKVRTGRPNNTDRVAQTLESSVETGGPP